MSIFALHYGSNGQFESLLQAFHMEKSHFANVSEGKHAVQTPSDALGDYESQAWAHLYIGEQATFFHHEL